MRELDMCEAYIVEINEIMRSSLPAEDKTRITGKRIKSINRYLAEAEEGMKDYEENGIVSKMSEYCKTVCIERIRKIKSELRVLMMGGLS